jgi:adenine phosphoribosyltransferase
MLIYLASQQPVKINAVKTVFKYPVEGVKCDSGVSEQPFGRDEIRRGAINRLNCIKGTPAVSFETGMIEYSEQYYDVTYCILRTRYGNFTSWSSLVQHDQKSAKLWLSLPEEKRRMITVGQIYDPKYPNNWYNRTEILTSALRECYEQMLNIVRSMPMLTIPASLKHFKGVPFLDIQDPLISNSHALTKIVKELAKDLIYDTVMVMDARGFLLCGEFARENYPIVMARKTGKLPGEELSITYEKEYGKDTLCIRKDAIKPNSKVIIIDDVIATGGTMLAGEKLVNTCNSEVVAFICPYAIVDGNNNLLCNINNLRYLCTQLEASSKIDNPYSRFLL